MSVSSAPPVSSFLSVPGYGARDWSNTDSDSFRGIKEWRQGALWLLNIDIASISISPQYAAVTRELYYALWLIAWDPVVLDLLIMREILAFFMKKQKFGELEVATGELPLSQHITPRTWRVTLWKMWICVEQKHVFLPLPLNKAPGCRPAVGPWAMHRDYPALPVVRLGQTQRTNLPTGIDKVWT